MKLRYQFRVYPSASQGIELAKAFGCARVVWNDALGIRRDAYKQGKPVPSIVELAKLVITEAKKTEERSWLGEVSAVVLQSSLRDLGAAYSNFFASGEGTRKGPKIGDVAVRWSRGLPSDPSSVTIIKDASGRYFASFVVEAEDKPLPELDWEETDTGIDLGLSSYAVLRGRKIASPKFFRRREKKLRRAQRKLARCQTGSNNRRKAKLALAKVHARIADQRRDFIEQETTRIVRESQAAYLEDLNVKGMARSVRFGKSVHDQSLGTFARTLEAKCVRYGRGFAKVGRWFPSTQLCSQCGALTGPRGREQLHIRQWVCDCGARHDRDGNAEINLRAEGRQLLAAGRAER